MTIGARAQHEIPAGPKEAPAENVAGLLQERGNRDLAREQGFDAESRLMFHKQYSGPLMEQLHGMVEGVLGGAEDRTELKAAQDDLLSSIAGNHWRCFSGKRAHRLTTTSANVP